MKKTYILSCILFLAFCLIACEEVSIEPTKMIQFEIEEDDLSKNQKDEAVYALQRRLVSLGAKNVNIVAEKEQKVTLNYQGNIKPKTLEKSFAITGKLEFFEVCQSKQVLYDYLDKKNTSKLKSDERITILKGDEVEVNLEEVVNFLEIIEFNFSYNGDPIFGYIAKRNKARAEELLIHQKPVFISALKRRVKFLLGKPDDYRKDKYPLHAVFVTSTNEAPLDGSYVTNAYAERANNGGHYVINIQKNEEGALIWERLTEKVYQEMGFIAVAIDDLVYCTATVTTERISGGRSQISANFTEAEAIRLARVIASGSIPKVKILKINTSVQKTSEN